MTAATVILARHGETTLNVHGQFRGRADPPLTPRGVAQAQALGELVAQMQPSAVASSPRLRAAETAAAVAAAVSITPLVDDRLEDIDYGAWTGLTPAEVAGRWPEEYRRWREDPETLVLPGGESLQGVRSRVAAAIAEWGSRSAGSTVVLVTHDVAIRAAICSALRAPLAAMHRIRVGLASVTVLSVAGGEVFLERVNDQHHLEGR